MFLTRSPQAFCHRVVGRSCSSGRNVVAENATIKDEVKAKQKKTGKITLSMPLSKNSIVSIKKHLMDKRQDEFIFKGKKAYTGKLITIWKCDRIIKGWMSDLGVEDTSNFSTHSMRKTKASVIYDKTKNVDAVRRLLGQSSVTATSAYLGVTDNSALDLARQYSI